ncbi:MAG: hypothetical protein HPY73_08880 [Methanomassiliicoccales archaeon]|nr:MAG: hypothetical protein HPY73_08880 [Methanomassiliicoccales archaeon]
MSSRSTFFKVQHGKMEVNVPFKLFEPGTTTIRPTEAEKLRKLLRSQYPWLSDNAVDVILVNAKEEMARILDSGKTAADRARDMIQKGELEKALGFLEAHLFINEDDIDAWYLCAEALMRLGKKDEGFEAMRHARSLAEKKGKIVRR